VYYACPTKLSAMTLGDRTLCFTSAANEASFGSTSYIGDVNIEYFSLL
jgi:hypothetical protein